LQKDDSLKAEKSTLQSAESLDSDTAKVGVRPGLRIGVLLEEGRRAPWMVDIIDRVMSADWLELSVVFVDNSTARRSRRVRSVQRYVDQLLFGVQERRVAELKPAESRMPGKSEELKTAQFDPTKAQDFHLDVLLDLRPGSPSASMAKSVRRGIWYFMSNVPGEDTASPEPIKEW
jgi:hypothetical protein